MGTCEEFEPATQVVKEGPENTILLLHLPGFVKEQVRITYVHSSRSIKVEGQRRAVEGGKRVGFNKVFQVPPNCKDEADKIIARFQNGLLTLTIPNQPPPTSTTIKSETGGGPPPKREDHVVKEEEKAADHLLNNKIGGVLKKPPTAEEKQKLGSLRPQQLNNGSDHDQEPPAPKINRDLAAPVLGRRRLNYYLQSNETSSSLLLNVGVALLVVVAVGAFATYKIRSKSKHC